MASSSAAVIPVIATMWRAITRLCADLKWSSGFWRTWAWKRQRLRLEWISASEGERVKSVINEMVEQVRALGPLDLPGRVADWDREMTELEGRVGASQPRPAGKELESAHV